jgi:hypothetical protein
MLLQRLKSASHFSFSKNKLIVIGLAFALIGSAVLVITHAAPGVNGPCKKQDFKEVKGLGCAKRQANGIYKVLLKDDTEIETHGPDTTELDDQGTSMGPGDPERQPICASDYYFVILYAYPSGTSNRLTTVRPTLLSAVKRMNYVLNEEGLESGGITSDFKVKCDASNEVALASFTTSDTSFGGVVSAAKAAGFNRSNEKYVVFTDAGSATANLCGTGSFISDERLTATNRSNIGPQWGVIWNGCWTGKTPMHELGHTIGAVQYNAPDSSGSGGHCNDGLDVMCYADGGDKSLYVNNVCTTKIHFDCDHDTYFNTAPKAGTYLASNWNLGNKLNKWIAFGNTTPPPPPTSLQADLNNDLKVDVTDLSILLSQFGKAGTADLNKNGVVDIPDLSILLSNYGKTG